jgi:hypothetical protein
VQASGALAIADIFLNGNVVYTAGSSANFVSKVQINTTGLAASTGAQMRVIGVSKDNTRNELLNATTYSTNVVVTAIINNHFFKQFTGI